LTLGLKEGLWEGAKVSFDGGVDGLVELLGSFVPGTEPGIGTFPLLGFADKDCPPEGVAVGLICCILVICVGIADGSKFVGKREIIMVGGNVGLSEGFSVGVRDGSFDRVDGGIMNGAFDGRPLSILND
jgi:hypothetical protein